MTQYAFDNTSEQERARLASLEALLDAGTTRHLEALGVSPGWSCLEVGGGGGSIAAWLCERVGSNGHVLATDLEPKPLERLTYANLEVRRHGIVSDLVPVGQFDLVHMRWVLAWLSTPRQVLARMVAALRPGGWLLVEETDLVTLNHSVAPEAFLKAARAFCEALPAQSGLDIFYGRRVYGDVWAQGLVEVGAEGRVCMLHGGGANSRWLRLSIERVRAHMVDAGTVSNTEIEEALALLDDPAFAAMSPLTMAVWGRRPER
jgi:SAM-dependent methyltransferase